MGWWGAPRGCREWPCTRTPALHPRSQTAQSQCRSWLQRPGTRLPLPRQLAGPCDPGAGERQGKREIKGSPRLTATPEASHTTWLWPPTPTWASTPSRIVAAGSAVAAASSSHSGVQMFPGEILWGGRRGDQGSVPQTRPGGLTSCLLRPFELLTS